MSRNVLMTLLCVVGLVALSGAADASPIDKVNDKLDHTEQWACDKTGYTCVLKVPDVPDPFDPCTCPPIQ